MLICLTSVVFCGSWDKVKVSGEEWFGGDAHRAYTHTRNEKDSLWYQTMTKYRLTYVSFLLLGKKLRISDVASKYQ